MTFEADHFFAGGETLHLHTENEGFIIDASAWCGLTGNELLEATSPNYLIRKPLD